MEAVARARYLRVASDYRLIATSLPPSPARESAGRLARDAYRLLITDAADQPDLSPDDSFALGQCHEALGETTKAEQRYRESMSAAATARGHLALARLVSSTDPAAAEEHFLQAAKLDPRDPRLPPFQLLLGAAYQRQRVWDKAIEHLQAYEKYMIALAEEDPTDISRFAKREATTRRLQDLKTYQSLMGQLAPAYAVAEPIQGQLVDLSELRGQVVVIDFFATWARASRDRMEELGELMTEHPDQPLTIVGLVLRVDDGVAAGQTADLENTKAYAQRAGISWPLGFVERETTDRFGVSTLPHTIVIDKQGSVQLIVQEGTDRNLQDLKKTIGQLLK